MKNMLVLISPNMAKRYDANDRGDSMKKIEAIIRPEKQDQVLNTLSDSGFKALTVLEVKGRGAQNGIKLQYRGNTITVDLIPKIEIMMVVEDDEVENVIQIIRKSAYTGKFGDGKIFVTPVERIEKVRMASD